MIENVLVAAGDRRTSRRAPVRHDALERSLYTVDRNKRKQSRVGLTACDYLCGVYFESTLSGTVLQLDGTVVQLPGGSTSGAKAHTLRILHLCPLLLVRST